MRTDNDLASRVQALEDRITRMSRDYDDTMYNIGSENLSSELSQRLKKLTDGLTPHVAWQTKNLTASEAGSNSYSINMGQTVKAPLFATWAIYNGGLGRVTGISASGSYVTVSLGSNAGSYDTITVAALV